MPSSLLDEAIKVGKELEGSSGRLASLHAQIAQAEETLKARQQELSKVEHESGQRLKGAETAWENRRRTEEEALAPVSYTHLTLPTILRV